MKIKKIFRGHVEKGKNILNEPERFMVHVASLEGKKTELTLEKSNERRSTRQNRYYRGVVCELIAEHCGYTNDEAHDALKIRFLSDRTENEHGLTRVRSTTSLSVDEFIYYVNEVVRFAAQDLQVYIPDPTSVEF